MAYEIVVTLAEIAHQERNASVSQHPIISEPIAINLEQLISWWAASRQQQLRETRGTAVAAPGTGGEREMMACERLLATSLPAAPRLRRDAKWVAETSPRLVAALSESER